MKTESAVRKAISAPWKAPGRQPESLVIDIRHATRIITTPTHNQEEKAQDQRLRSVDDGVRLEVMPALSVCTPCDSPIESYSAPQARSGVAGSIAGRGNRRGRPTAALVSCSADHWRLYLRSLGRTSPSSAIRREPLLSPGLAVNLAVNRGDTDLPTRTWPGRHQAPRGRRVGERQRPPPSCVGMSIRR
jgi:hypothetical protein